MKITRFLKIGFSVVGILVIAYLLYVFLMMHTFFQEGGLITCSEAIVTELPSPHGRYVASVFSGSCGATTPFVTSVNVKGSSESYLPDKSGMFTRGRVFYAKGQIQVRLSWQDESKLIIEHSPSDQLTKETKWHDVTVSYRLLN